MALNTNLNYTRNDLLVWVDLETTGFDLDNNMLGCREHKILEIGVHITDSHLNVLDQGLNIIIHQDVSEIKKVAHPTALKMHEESGLLDAVKQSNTSLKEAESLILKYIKSFGIVSRGSPLCGNNVSFDKNFIDAQMGELGAFLHYRKIDVSSFKEFIVRLMPSIELKIEKKIAHRAIEDIKESIEEMRIYKDLLKIDI